MSDVGDVVGLGDGSFFSSNLAIAASLCNSLYDLYVATILYVPYIFPDDGLYVYDVLSVHSSNTPSLYILYPNFPYSAFPISPGFTAFHDRIALFPDSLTVNPPGEGSL